MISSSVSVHALHSGWSITVDDELADRRFSDFLELRDADGDPLPLLGGGGCDSKSNSADEAARRALRELASLEACPPAADVKAALPGLSFEVDGGLDVDGDSLDEGRGAMKESCTKS